MKVSQKILLGYAVLVLLMISGIGYELWVLDRVQGTNDRLSEINRAALDVSRLGDVLRFVEEFTEKYLIIGAEYQTQLDESRQAFEETIVSMETGVRFDSERRALGQLRETWTEFQTAFEAVRSARPPGTYGFLPVRLEELLLRMDTQVDLVDAEVRSVFAAEVDQAQATSDQAFWVAWAAAIAAIGLAGGVVLSMIRSIKKSFRSFKEATASVAEGEFDRRLAEDRKDEFGELARSFNAMAARLDELDRLKKDFVSSVSHELKSPIAASREIVQLLLDQVPGPVNDEQRRLLELSIRSSRRLSAMVGGLLDLARLDAGTMRYDMTSCDLKELVASTLEEFEVAAAERGLRVESGLEDVGSVQCDRDRIVQVVGNLLDNAMKFSSRGALISARLENLSDGRNPQVKSGVMFSLIDEGPGVADINKKRIFGRFQQFAPEGARQGGVGLGLAICSSIVEGHRGRIWVEDNPRGGAVFRFVLPQEPQAAPPQNRPDDVSSGGTRYARGVTSA